MSSLTIFLVHLSISERQVPALTGENPLSPQEVKSQLRLALLRDVEHLRHREALHTKSTGVVHHAWPACHVRRKGVTATGQLPQIHEQSVHGFRGIGEKKIWTTKASVGKVGSLPQENLRTQIGRKIHGSVHELRLR